MPIPTPTRSLPTTAVETEPGTAAITVHPTRFGTVLASIANLNYVEMERIKFIMDAK